MWAVAEVIILKQISKYGVWTCGNIYILQDVASMLSTQGCGCILVAGGTWVLFDKLLMIVVVLWAVYRLSDYLV